MAEENKMSESEKKKEDWMNSKWRPMMGWSYMLTCVCDFVVFPVLWSILQSISKGQVNVQWQPITLQGAGLYHIAMGAVLGIAAMGRTQEKLAGANNGGANSGGGMGGFGSFAPSAPAPVAASTASVPLGGNSLSTMSAPATGGFGSVGNVSPGFDSAPPISTGFGGKKAPPELPQPAI